MLVESYRHSPKLTTRTAWLEAIERVLRICPRPHTSRVGLFLNQTLETMMRIT